MKFAILLVFVVIFELLGRVESSSTCDASAPQANGGVGDCTSTLASGSTCQPTCNSGYTVSGPAYCLNGNLEVARCMPDSSLTHWFDFSSFRTYGNTQLDTISSFTDIMGNSTSHSVRGNVQYKLAVKSGLNAIYMNEVYAACYFNTAKVGRNPELFMAYRVVSTPTISGVNFGDRGNGYGFGTYKQSADYIGTMASSGALIQSAHAPYANWHVANVYYGDSDGFISIDGGATVSFGISGAYSASSLTQPHIGAYDYVHHWNENYVGEVVIFNSRLSSSERSTVTTLLMNKWVTATCDASGAPANGGAGDCTNALVSGSTCQPTCDSGYTVSGTSACSLGSLTAATCGPSPCDASAAPTNSSVGDCTSSLASGFTCQPTCNAGYTVSGTSSCSLGTLTAATCAVTYCAANERVNGGNACVPCIGGSVNAAGDDASGSEVRPTHWSSYGRVRAARAIPY